MNKQYLTFLLILIMIITPIAKAVDHCEDMNVPAEISGHQEMLLDSADIFSHLSEDQQHNKQMDIDCNICDGCLIHACHSFGITPSSPILISKSEFSFANSISTIPDSITPFPQIRPPISIL